jgi:hypothetical protein
MKIENGKTATFQLGRDAPGAGRPIPARSAYLDGLAEQVASQFGWKLVESGANVTLLVPYDAGVFFNSQEIDGSQVATPIQVYMDLQASRGRAEEAAQAVRKVIEQIW